MAVVTNLSPNHLDVHKDMQEYIDAKKNIFLHQSAFSRTVLNAGNQITAAFAPEVRGDCWMFRRDASVDRGVWCDEETVYVGERALMPVSQIKIPGWHNVENYMGGHCRRVGRCGAGNDPAGGRQLQRGGAPGGVCPGAAWGQILQRLHCHLAHPGDFRHAVPLPQKIILIAGGYDKHIPFEPLGPAVCEKVKTLILMGRHARRRSRTR